MERNWTKEETIIAFNVYCKIPFKESRKTHPLIVKYAQIIGRSPSALNMKVGNLGRLDPKLKEQGITGLTHGAKIEKEVWAEFYENPDKLTYESERLIAQFAHKEIGEVEGIDISDLPDGKERVSIVKQRVNQSFFRSVILSSYDFKCCISGIKNPELLEACHIVDWSCDNKNRTNPENGLCLNILFHRAYDKNLLGITPNLHVEISNEMIDGTCDDDYRDYLKNINGKKLQMPTRFYPNPEFLEIHYNRFLKR